MGEEKHWSFQSNHRTHYCRRCKSHDILVKCSGHMNCPFKDCTCVNCKNISSQNMKAAHYIRRRRIHAKIDKYIFEEAQKNCNLEEVWRIFYAEKKEKEKNGKQTLHATK